MEMATLIESSRWRRFRSTEAPASRCDSASGPRYRLAKDIGIVAVVVTELKFGKVERQIFLAYVVVGADDAALEQRPERSPRFSSAQKLSMLFRMNLAAHISPLARPRTVGLAALAPLPMFQTAAPGSLTGVLG